MVNWSRVLGCNLSFIIKFYELTHVCIGIIEVMELPTSSQGGVSWIWPPNAKIAMGVIDQNPRFPNDKGMHHWGHCVGGQGVSWLKPHVSEPTDLMDFRSDPQITSYGELYLTSKFPSGTHGKLVQGPRLRMELHNQVLWDHTCFSRANIGDGSIHELSGRVFLSLTPQCKNCTRCHKPKP